MIKVIPFLWGYVILIQKRKEKTMKEKVEAVLERIRPVLQSDGGDVELIDVVNGVVKVKLTGACGACPMSIMTLKNGIETALKEEIPEVVSVESV